MLRGLKGATLAEAANQQLLRRGGGASVSVSLCFVSAPAHRAGAGSGDSPDSDGVQLRRITFMRRVWVSGSRMLVTFKETEGEEAALSEVKIRAHVSLVPKLCGSDLAHPAMRSKQSVGCSAFDA